MRAGVLDAAGGGALGICSLIGSVGFQGNDVMEQAWFEGAERNLASGRGKGRC